MIVLLVGGFGIVRFDRRPGAGGVDAEGILRFTAACGGLLTARTELSLKGFSILNGKIILLAISISAISLGPTAYSLGAPTNKIKFTPAQIVKRLNFELAHPGLHSNFFHKGSVVPKLAYVGHCSKEESHGLMGQDVEASHLYTCPLNGLAPGILGDVTIQSEKGNVKMVALSIENTDGSSAGIAAMSYIIASDALILAVDKDALKTGIASQENFRRISRDLTPSLSKQQTSQKVSADGLVFARQLLAGDQVLTIAPAP